ncbi:MAG: hypothetical protein RR212_06970 [Bacteroidales bacterium]
MHKITCKIALLALLAPCLPAVAQKEFNAFDHILQKRPQLDSIISSRWYDNIFLSGGLGVEGVVNGVEVLSDRSRYGLTGAIHIGKWFNSVSALRLGFQAGIPQNQLNDPSSRYFVHYGVTADYMFNLSSYLYGYNPKRIFNVIPFAGAGVHMGSVLREKLRPSASVRAGIQATFRLSQGLDFFIEPVVSLYSDDYNQQQNWRRFDIVPALMAGLTYTMVPRSIRTGVTPFYNDHLFDNIFVSGGIGGGLMVNGSTMNRFFYNHVGPEFFVGIGNWFTPVSGARLSVTSNVFKRNNRIKNKYITTFGGQLDYMVNLDALFEGYHANRLFRIYGITGLNVAFPEKTGNNSNTVGFGIGIQGNFRLSSTTDLFIEPRLNIYSNKFAGGVTSSKYDVPATVLFGLTYRRPDNGTYRRTGFESNNIADNTFISMGGGLNAPVNGHIRRLKLDAIQPFGTIAVGKWITPYSGFRLHGQAGLLGETNTFGQPVRSKLVGFGLDYLLNVSNFIGGYNPDRPVSLIATLGGYGLFNNATDRFSEHGLEWGLVGGLQGRVRISPSVQLYLEPQLGLYTDGLTDTSFPPLSGDLLASLSAGVIYNFRQYDLPAYRQKFESAQDGKWFASVAGGVGTVMNSAFNTWHPGPQIALSFGKEYTPLSTWRTAIRYTHLPELPKHKKSKYQSYYGVDADYMMDLTTLSAGYDSERIFRLYGIAGISMGAAESREEIKFVPGLHLGIQASVRITNQLSFYLEPRGDVFGKYFMNNNNDMRKFDAAISGMAGVTWKFNM